MTDFRMFLKILKSKIVIIMVYVGIFTVMMAAGINDDNNKGGISYSAYNFDIAVIDHDNSTFSKAITSYIEKNMSLTDIIQTEEGMEDALFERIVEYILIIPEHYQEDLLAGKTPVMESKKVPDAYGAKFAETVISQYVDTFYLYQNQFDSINEQTMGTVLELTNQSVEKGTDVTVKKQSISSEKKHMTVSFNFAAYTILACVIWVVGEILSIYFEKNISRRMSVSPISPMKQNIALITYSSVTMLVVWGISMVINLVLLGEALWSLSGLLMTINMFLISLIALACGFAIAAIFRTKNARNAAANVIALAFSFISGIFVPLSMLSSEVKSVAAFTPTYWYALANEKIGELKGFSLPQCKEIFQFFGIELLFFVMVISVGLVSKRQGQKD